MGQPDPIEGGTSVCLFSTKITAQDELTTIYKRLVKYLGILVQLETNL